MKKYFVFALIIGVLAVAPSFAQMARAGGLTQSQIDAIVSLLQSFGAEQTVVINVQSVLSGKPTIPSTTAWCHDFNTNLRIDDEGSEILALHKALAKEGLLSDYYASDTFEGSTGFSENTSSAVTGFQQKYADEILTPNGLKYGTGFVGPSTRAKMNKLYGCGVAPKPFPIPTPIPVPTPVPVPVPPPTCDISIMCVTGYAPYDTGEKDSNNCPIKKCIPPAQNQPPTIHGVSGPTVLKIRETGNWLVKASDPEQGNLSYSVRWGDEGTTGVYSAAQRQWSYTQSAEFTHSYASAGIYNPTFTVTDDKGLSARTSVSAQVGEIVTSSITVLSPNGGESWQQGQTYQIKWSSNDNIGKNIFINLNSAQSNTGYVIRDGSTAYSGADTGQFSWTIPSNIPTGSYKIYMGDVTSGFTDTSDAAFSIAAAGTNLPDLIISDFSWTPSSPKSVENITMSVKVKNIGTASAQNFSVTNLWDSNGKEINISNLAPNTETTVQGTIGGLSIPGPNVFNISVNVRGEVAESNKNNNSLSKTINVSPVYSGDGLATLKHWQTWQLNNGYVLYADGENILGQTPYKVRFKIYDPKANYQVVATSPDLIIGDSWFWSPSNQSITIKVNAINVSSPGNANWSAQVTASSVLVATPSITVLSPNGGEKLVQGQTNRITWSGGKYPVQVGIVRSTYPTDTTVEGWINLGANPGGYIDWDTNRIGSLTPTPNNEWWTINPGQYKILLVSPSATGDQCFGGAGCVYDVSNSSFTIVAPTNVALNLAYDIDGNGKVDQGTDGTLISRFLFGSTENSLVSGAIGTGATRTSASAIQSYLALLQSSSALDADGNGQNDALTDGILISRYMAGYVGTSLINGAVATDATRKTADQILNFLNNAAIPSAATPLTASSAEIIGSQSQYTAGQTIKFSVKGAISDGSVPSPTKGFHVQAWMQTINPVATVYINGVAQSVNSVYNSNTGYWDVTMTAPSDTSQTYKIEAAFYCSQASLGCSSGQINKSFTFNVVSASVPSITVLSPNGGETWQVGKDYEVKWNISGTPSSDWLSTTPGYYDVSIKLYKSGNFVGYISTQHSGSNYISWNPNYIWTSGTGGVYNTLISGNDYSVRVSALRGYNNELNIYDTSDAAFSIAAAAPTTYTLSVTKSGSGSGTVSESLGGIYCGSTCSNNYNNGAAITLTATPASGSTFTGWSGACSSTGICALTMNAAKSLTATFTTTTTTTLTPTITVLSPNGGEQWKFGASQTIRWATSGITSGKFGLYLMTTNGDMCSIGSPDALAGSYTTTLQENQSCPSNPYYPTLKAGQYKVNIDAAPATGIENTGDTSDAAFSIAAAAPSIVCTDSDSGQDYNKRGTATGLYSSNKDKGIIYGEGDGNKVTYRYDSTLNNSIYYDHCFDSTTSKQLNEGYCDVGTGLLQSIGTTCSYGCKEGACLPVPSITVLSPGAGETWVQGKTYRVNWTSSGVTTANMILTSGNTSQNTGGLITNSLSGSGSADFTVPANFPTGSAQFYLGDNNSTTKSTQVAVTIIASVSVSAPVVSSINQTSAKAGDTIYVYINSPDASAYILFDDTLIPPLSNSGATLSFTLPAYATVGAHTIRVKSMTSGLISNTVSLTVVASSAQSSINQIAGVLGSMRQVMSYTIDVVVVEAMKKVINQLEEKLNNLKNQ